MKNWLSGALMVELVALASGAWGGTLLATNDASNTGEFRGCAGAVVETMDAAGYTYVQVDTGSEKIWAAAPQFPVKVGDKVVVPPGVPMQNYHSKTLDRTFATIFFVGTITPAGQPISSMAPNPHAELKDDPHAGLKAAMGASPPAGADFRGLEKPVGGWTVAEVYAQKSTLAGKQVLLRGKVVKFNLQIMGRNWVHVQDGTGASGANDLTVTTADTAQVGDTVLVNGTLVLKKDFGYGYTYELMLEDARVTVQQKAGP